MIPKVLVDVAKDSFSLNTLVYIEVCEGVSEHLMAYIKAVASTCIGFKMDHDINNKIKYAIDSHLVYLANNGQLFRDIDGTWGAIGFLWVNNEH